MSQKILAIYREDSTIFLGMEGVETNDIKVVSDIEISAIPVVIDVTNSTMPNTVTVDEKRDNENNLGQIKCSSDYEYPLTKNEQPSSGTKKKNHFSFTPVNYRYGELHYRGKVKT